MARSEALAAHRVEGVGRAARAQHVGDADGLARGGGADGVVEQKHVDRIAPEPLQAARQAGLHLAGDVVEPGAIEMDLGRDHGPLVDLGEQPAKRLLRAPVAIHRRRVDPVDAAIERHADGPPPGLVVGVDQQAADVAAAEHDLGHLQPGFSERAIVHSDAPLGVRQHSRMRPPTGIAFAGGHHQPISMTVGIMAARPIQGARPDARFPHPAQE